MTVAFAGGLLAAAVQGGEPALEAIDPERPVTLAGRVAAHWVWDGEGWSAPLRVERLVQGRWVALGCGEEVRLRLPGAERPPPFGSRLRLRGHLRRSAGFANAVPVEPGPWRMRLESRRLLEVEAPPGAVARLAGRLRERVEAAQREAVAMAAEQIGEGEKAVGTAPANAGTTSDRAPSPIFSRVPSTGGAASGELDPAAVSPGPALVRALVLGDAGAVPERWRRGLRRTGLAHVLAVSGLHVGLVAAAVLLAAAPLPVRPRLVLALAAVGLYLLVAGPRPALLRATWMALLAAAALLLGRPPLAGNALAVAAAGLALARPALVDDLGFRLTASATAGLVFLAPRLAVAVRAAVRWAGERLPARGLGGVAAWALRGLGPLAAPLSASLAAQAASVPFALPAFHLLCTTSPLSNLVAVPWTALFLVAGMAWTGLAAAAPEAAGRLVPWLDLAAAPFGWTAEGGPEAWGVVGVVAPVWVCGVMVAGVASVVLRGGGDGDGGVGGEGSPGEQRATRRTLEGGSLRLPRAAIGIGLRRIVRLARSRRPRSSPPRPPRLAVRDGTGANGTARGGGRAAGAGTGTNAAVGRSLWRRALRMSLGRMSKRLSSFLPLLPLLTLTFLWPAFRWGSLEGRRAAGVEVVMLDVGQGDAILLRDGNSAVLVDGGGWRRGDIGGRVVLPALLGEGVDRLRAVVVTHPDRDHCQGLVDLASYLPVEEVWTADGFQADPCVAELAAAALAGRPAAVRVLGSAGRSEMRVGRWRLRVLHPEGSGPLARRLAAAARGNDHSLVLAAEALGRRVLLTGDVEAAAERAVLRRWRETPERLRAGVLKVAHHGSKTSSGEAFLRAVEPRLALVSAGPNNPYHHPSSTVVERFERHGVPLLRTDRHGFVRLAWDGPRGWRLRTGR